MGVKKYSKTNLLDSRVLSQCWVTASKAHSVEKPVLNGN